MPPKSEQLCRSCKARVYMLKHVNTHKDNPIDAEPGSDGNIIISLTRGTYNILTAAERAVFKESGGELRTSHFATCPDAKTFRR